MAVVKERETVVIVGPQLKSQSEPKPLSSPRYGGPTPPPTPPTGGGGGGGNGGGSLILIFLAILLAVVLSRLTFESYSVALGNTLESQLTEFAAWFLLIVSSAKASVFSKEPDDLSLLEPVERELEKLKSRIIRRYWDGLLVMVTCFHLAAYTNVTRMIPLIEAAAAFITAAYIIERLRFQFYPQSAADVADILS